MGLGLGEAQALTPTLTPTPTPTLTTTLTPTLTPTLTLTRTLTPTPNQARVKPVPADECPSDLLGAHCYPELAANEKGDTAPFGRNWTHPDSPLDHPWRYFSAEQLG